MTFDDYQRNVSETAIYPDVGGLGYVYPALGLANEAGEVLGKIKKAIRDDEGQISADRRLELVGEMGDTLWYLAELAGRLGLSLDQIAEENLTKLKGRKARRVIQGSGDNR